MNNRFSSARKFASNIVKSRNLTPPIDPVETIRSFGINIIEEDNQLGIEAFSELGETPQITVNTEFTFPARKRFTLAHELGHIIIPWHNGDIKCDTDKPYSLIEGTHLLDTQELEANIFASELLMPHDWLVNHINTNEFLLEELINTVRQKAQTSVMACLYALEEALPPGNIYYVKKHHTDYWKKFSSENTFAPENFCEYEKSFEFLNLVCEKNEHFTVSQYEIVYYGILRCPDEHTIRNIYLKSSDIIECINIISNYEPLKVLPILKDVLISLKDVFCCIIFEENNFWHRITHPESKLKINKLNYNSLINILKNNDLNYYTFNSGSFKFVFVKEKIFDLVQVKSVEPNSLLKSLLKEIYPQTSEHMIHRINGIIAHINSSIKDGDEKLLYNVAKYRFVCDQDMVDFYNHSDFDTYIINKIRTMLHARKKKW